MSSNVQIASTVKGVSELLSAINRTTNPLSIQRSIQQFQQQNHKIGLTEDVLSEAIDDAMDDVDSLGEADEDSEEVLKKVFEEVNLQIKQSVRPTYLYFHHHPLTVPRSFRKPLRLKKSMRLHPPPRIRISCSRAGLKTSKSSAPPVVAPFRGAASGLAVAPSPQILRLPPGCAGIRDTNPRIFALSI